MSENESNSVFLIKISGTELKKFKEYVEEGREIDNNDIIKLRRIGIRDIEDFCSVDNKIRFWTFTRDFGIKENDILLFLCNDSNALYIFKSSRVIKNEEAARILGCHDDREKPFIVLLKYKQLKYKYRINNYIADRIDIYSEECERIGDNIFKCEIAFLNDVERLLIDLEDFLKSKSYKVPDHLIAQFYTALKTKGFVILSGLSGTGKTKIALNFIEIVKGTELLYPVTKDDLLLNLEEEIKGIRDTIYQKNFAIRFFNYSKNIYDVKAPFILWVYIGGDIKRVVMGLWVTEFKITTYNNLPDDWKERLTWIKNVYRNIGEEWKEDKKVYVKIEDILEVREDINKFIDLETNSALSAQNAYRTKFRKVKSSNGLVSLNHVYLPVRPDWRDPKPLLGYYNPLDKKYHKTPLLDLILRAKKDYEMNGDKAMPYFIILDEMNLARVEYYFADFLSVLESGRDKNGFTREPIKLHNVDEVEREQGIPKEIKLPPNLYIIGTVNIDETTYMFSPKVLDRAFVIEFHEVDMNDYPPSLTGDLDYSELRNKILEDLRNGGKFLVYSDKEVINEAIKELKAKDYWRILQKLNRALEPFDLHFGYRVIDEIALFFKSAKESMDKNIIQFEDDDEIFDLALLMKVLPKFHGNKKKLEKPLLFVLKVAKDSEIVDEDFEKSSDDLLKEILKIEESKDKSVLIIK